MNLISTSSIDETHGAFDIVHLKVYVFPATPLNVEVGLEAFANDPPAPLIMLHAPVPTIGVLAASVIVVNPHVEKPI